MYEKSKMTYISLPPITAEEERFLESMSFEEGEVLKLFRLPPELLRGESYAQPDHIISDLSPPGKD